MGEYKFQQMLKRHLERIHCTPCVSDHLPVTLYFCWAKGICGLPPNWVTAEIVMSNILCYSYQESLILRLLLSTCVHSQGFNDPQNEPFYKLMQWVLRVGLLLACREDPDVRDRTLGHGGAGNLQQLRKLNEGIWTSWESKWGERIPQGTQNVCFQVEFERALQLDKMASKTLT